MREAGPDKRVIKVKKQPQCQDPPRTGLFGRPFRRVYIGLGSNIQAETNLPRAVSLLCRYTRVEAVSTAWETPPDGLSGPNFLNAVAEIQTQLPAGVLKSLVLRAIEIQMGRIRTINKYASRTIDLDILIYEDHVVEPAIWTRAILALPLAELLPGFRNPQTQETLAQAAQRLQEKTPARPRPEVFSG